ncbi:unnamed protein product [Eruca vesicaria subsp. sativa]|uniref:Chalcone isomerase domain-containing protein n=1 Tax=Eruca vesicaria subsp. sativa TaxID=29727 RepID=A0ABC8IR29_ERUVS|nr:unnamed protein product [Eruca vesicaria subsp. sativa]
MTLADSSSESVVEPKTGFSFSATIGDSRRLLGVGLRKKSVLGLKNIDVYAFGIYADCDDVKKLVGEKYASLAASELRGNKDFLDHLMEADIKMTIRLQIVYGKLNIRSVRNAFQESVGNRLKKFGGLDNDEFLQRYKKLNRKIDLWEAKKRDKARRKLDKSEVRDNRTDWVLKMNEPIAGNYYPLNLGIYTKDKKVELSVLVDRATGGGSIKDGALAWMIREEWRRALRKLCVSMVHAHD